jgi:hypothetical protein
MRGILVDVEAVPFQYGNLTMILIVGLYEFTVGLIRDTPSACRVLSQLLPWGAGLLISCITLRNSMTWRGSVIAIIAEFERESTQGRSRSGIAVAKARGKRLGRQPGAAVESDRR